MKVSVVGCGYLGAVHAASMAELGHEVVGVDVDQKKVDRLTLGKAPFFEPGLPEVLEKNIHNSRLRFTTDFAHASDADVHFIAVGTPQTQGEGAADLSFVNAAVQSLIPHLKKGAVVVGKSTVPVGTAARLAPELERAGAVLAWNPEFLREGYAVKDTLTPDRIVYGLAPDAAQAAAAKQALDEVYAEPLAAETPLIVTGYQTAELVKVAANAFLATKISFINAMAEVSEVVNADVTQLADAIGYDPRIGRRFLGAGIGFGGGCLPKDIRAFTARAEELGRGDSVAFLKEVDAINLRRRDHTIDLVVSALDGEPYQKKVAVLGLAFKPHSDDIRDSPALEVAVRLHGLGADVIGVDPQAAENARRQHPQLTLTDSLDDALSDADAVVLVTDWPEYRHLDPEQVKAKVSQLNVVDARNAYDPQAWRKAGWTYYGLGRS